MDKSFEGMAKMLDMHGLRHRMDKKKSFYEETSSISITMPATQQDNLFLTI